MIRPLILSCAMGVCLIPVPTPAEVGEPDAAAKPAAADSGEAVFAAIDAFIAEQKIDTKSPNWKGSLPKPPQLEFDLDKQYSWDLETSLGKIVVRLRPDVAPMHVSSTIYLTRLGFYDGVVFHRIIPDFMAQGGDPTGTGSGGPGYEYEGEFDSTVKHDEGGMLSMANAGPGTDGSQFFLTFAPTSWLDGKHTIFGSVVGGKSTLKRMEEKGSSSGRPSERISIDKATIRIE